MISALFYSWLVLLILTVVDIEGHIYWTSNEQFLCKRHLAQLKNEELAKLQEGVSCKLELQTGSPNQCRNRHKDTERKEGLWWTLPIPPMEVEGLLENKPIIKPGLVLAEKPQSSSSRECVLSSTTSAARRSSTTSLPNSSLQRSNVSPAIAGPKGEARSSSTMKISAVTTLAELVSSSTALSVAVTSAKEKSNAKIAQIQKPQVQPVISQHSHNHQHHQHQSSVNAYSQSSPPNKGANNAVSTGNKAITSMKSSSNGKAVPAKHSTNKIKNKNHPCSLADQMTGLVLQHPHKRQVQACADSQSSVSNNIGNESLILSFAPKTSGNGKVATYNSYFTYRIKPKQQNQSDVMEQQLNLYQSEMNLKSNPSIPENKLFTPNENENSPVLSLRINNKKDIEAIVPIRQVYKHPHPSPSELNFADIFLEPSSTSTKLLPTAVSDEEPTKISDNITKHSSNPEPQESTTEHENTPYQELTPDSQLRCEEARNWVESQTSNFEIIPTHTHLKPYPGDRSHLVNSKKSRSKKRNKQNLHSNETDISFGVQVSLKGISAASSQQMSGRTKNLEAKINPSSHSYKAKQQGLIMKKESTEKQDHSSFFHGEPMSIVKNFRNASHKFIMKTLKEAKEPSSNQSGLELMTLIGPLITVEKSFLQDNPNQALLDHTSLPLLSANFIDHTILLEDNFLNNNILMKKNEEEEY